MKEVDVGWDGAGVVRPQLYYIQNLTLPLQGPAYWWVKGARLFTNDLDNATKYTQEDLDRMQIAFSPTDRAHKVEDIDAVAQRAVLNAEALAVVDVRRQAR